MDERTDGWMDRRNFSPVFYRISSPIGSAALPTPSLCDTLLGATKHLYRKVCLSVPLSVNRSVTLSHLLRFRRALEHHILQGNEGRVAQLLRPYVFQFAEACSCKAHVRLRRGTMRCGIHAKCKMRPADALSHLFWRRLCAHV